ncbi:MAG TPA: pseudouridine synthase [Candidatus Dormibacteraeota bacterium]|nr:pseudouridine synthase [Candidatus Dormibacteraeota bacterium]
MSDERLQKLLAAAGVASRRRAEALIEAGRVTVDGRVAALGDRADPGVSAIAVDGRPIRSSAPLVHLACHKPTGVTSTVADRHAARTVLDLVPPDLRPAGGRLYPVGRLDRDSEGLLLLTNDGPWSEHVIHPRYGVEREYAVALARPLEPAALDGLAAGIDLEEGRAQLSGLRLASAAETARLMALVDPRPAPGLAWYRATLGQGWKRQLRRMFAAVGVPVVRLVRVRIGPVRLGDMRSGTVRPLRPDEVRALARRMPSDSPGAGGHANGIARRPGR